MKNFLLTTTITVLSLALSAAIVYMSFLACDAMVRWAKGIQPKSPTVVVEGEISVFDMDYGWTDTDDTTIQVTFKESGQTPWLKVTDEKWNQIHMQHHPVGGIKNREKVFVITYRESDKRLLSMYPK